MVVQAEHAGDRVGDLRRHVHRPGAGVKVTELRMRVVEQRDAKGLADIGHGAGEAHPGRDRLLVGDDEVVGLGKGLDRRDGFFIRAILARELIAGHVGARSRKLVVETGQIRQLLAAANADGELDPALLAGAAHRFRSGRQLMDAVGKLDRIADGGRLGTHARLP